MILLVRTKDGQEVIVDVNRIETKKSHSRTVRTVINPIAEDGANWGDIDLNECSVELLPNG
jgi:hypothetical protein